MRVIPITAASAALWVESSVALWPSCTVANSRTTHSTMSVCSGGLSTTFAERFGFSAVEAARIEPKLPTWIRAKQRIDQVDATSTALQHRLTLSQSELRRVVSLLPTVLGLSYEFNLEPSLASLQQRLLLSEEELKLSLIHI